jgi:Nif-specific regulatory protein
LESTASILLRTMKEYMGVECGMLALHHRRTGTIFVHQSIGLSEEEQSRGIYALGEGITGKVVATKCAYIVPKIRDEPLFLGKTHVRTKDRLDYSFLCIPIMRGADVLGTLSIEKRYASQESLQEDVAVLTFIASIIAQSIELYLLENEERAHWEQENRRLQEALQAKFHPSNIIGTSAPMRQVYSLLDKIAKTRVSVLILGESGVGKELVANAIHYHSAFAEGPFVKFNCAALPESIMESELFGHEKGAFTGADTLRKGRFEEADGGTIFLDEIGELSLSTQAKLLRVLQERAFERVGGNQPVQVNLRVIAATNRDLRAMVADKTFREDLFYRLNVFPVVIPPLRERGSDIVALCDYFLVKYAKENGKRVTRFSRSALQMLMRYPWPGNVRELANVIERAVILCDDDTIDSDVLPPSLQASEACGSEDSTECHSKIDMVEHNYILNALRTTRGNLTAAARELGMTRRMLGLRVAKYKIDYRRFRG